MIEVIKFEPKGKYPDEIEREFIKCPEYVECGHININNEWFESRCYELVNDELNE